MLKNHSKIEFKKFYYINNEYSGKKLRYQDMFENISYLDILLVCQERIPLEL